jgi:hypothetical protein
VAEYHCGGLEVYLSLPFCGGSRFFAHDCDETNGLTTSTKVHADGGRSDEKQQDISAGGVCTAYVGWDISVGSG